MTRERKADIWQAAVGDFLTLSRNVVYNIISQILVGVTGLATIPVLTRTLDVEEYAYFSFLLLFVTSVTILEGLRPPFVQMIHEYEKKNAQRAFLQVAFRINLCIALIVFGLAFGVFWVLSPELADLHDALLVGAAMFFLFAGSLPAAAVESAQQIGLVQLARSTTMAATYGSFVLLSLMGTGVEYYTLSIAGLQALLVGIYAILALRHYSPRLNGDGRGKERGDVRYINVIGQCVDGLVTGVSNAVMNFSDRLVVYLLVSAAAYATYSLSYDIGIRLGAVPLLVGYPLFTLLSERLAQRKTEVLALYQIVAKCTLCMSTLLGVSGIFWAREIVLIFGGEQYVDGVPVLQVILFAALVAGLTVIALPYLRAVGDFRSQWQYNLSGGLVVVGLAWWWVGDLGIVGAGLALIVGRALADGSLVAVTMGRIRDREEDGKKEDVNFRLARWLILSIISCVWASHPTTGGGVEFGLLVAFVISGSLVMVLSDAERGQVTSVISKIVSFLYRKVRGHI